MLERLQKYIDHYNLCTKTDNILVAVSGGVDSVVLLDMLQKIEYNCSIAHCNFQLRGSESDEDEKFVISLGKRYNFKTHTVKFNTKNYAVKYGLSTQMAARDLRYKWFEELASDFGYNCIAIAHNADDNIETFHLNLTRGTGLSGLKGIEPKLNRIIRPLLWAYRNDILFYCKANNLSYREDSSNKKTDYKRNYLRHEILPKFKTLNPSYSETITQSIEYFRQSEEMLEEYYNLLSDRILQHFDNEIRIKIDELKRIKHPNWFLYELLSKYGFTSSQIADIAKAIDAESGKRFESGDKILIKDRDYFVLSLKSSSDDKEYLIYGSEGYIDNPISVKWKTISNENIKIQKRGDIAFLDAENLEYPLKMRRWRKGDSFQPFGMRRKKKLSDYFTDKKLTILEKGKVWLLVSGEEIIWVIGYRIDDRFKVSDKTSTILRLEVKLK